MTTTSSTTGSTTATKDEHVVRALVGWPEVCQAIDDAGARLVALLRRLPPASGSLPTPGVAWTVAETVAHLVSVARRGADPRRARTLAELAELNQTGLEEVEPRAVDLLADLLEEELRTGSLRRQGLLGTELFPLHFGVVAELPGAACYLLADLLVHGHDIAGATGQRWELPPDEAALALHGVLPTMRTWVEPEVLAGPVQRVVVTLPPRRAALVLVVGDGGYTVSADGGAEGDVVDPSRALLALARRCPRDPAVDRFASWFAPI